MVAYWPLPAGVLVAGRNTLRIEPMDTLPDDIRVGWVELRDRPMEEVLSEARVEVEVVDAESGALLPGRITVVDAEGRLQMVGGASSAELAVRPGLVYTGAGRAAFGLPAGSYRIYAGRGFEYGVDSVRVVLRPGDRVARRLAIRREVPTRGWISADTHVHTRTYSGHGDATAGERVLSLAGEGIELPVLTDHNVHVDLDSLAGALGVRGFFTPVVGNEVTTRVGHFNIFPVSVRTPAPDAGGSSWDAVSRAIQAASAQPAVILNHARDVHRGFRPFGPERHIAVAGMSLDGWALPANAMEVVNSGAQQSDVMQLFTDWFGMLNRGYALTPVGSSDSHDVGRYLVGQGRTYIRGRDEEPGRIDVAAAVENFRAGRVMVSFGLLAEVTVDQRYGPGDLVPAGGGPLPVDVRVLGPSWLRADRVTLYANGQAIRTATIAGEEAPGVKWSGTWEIPRPAHDVFLVAIAQGPGDRLPFWPIAKPYQPASPEWSPRVIGASGAVWIDADGDARPTAAHAYASRLVENAAGSLPALIRGLERFDEAVAVQAAALLLERGIPPSGEEVQAALRRASPATRRGFDAFGEAWKESVAARAGGG